MANLLKVIHTGKKSLGWDDETYRAVLARVTGKLSARDCTEAELEALIRYMRGQGFAQSVKIGRRPSVAADRKSILSKIEALLSEADRPWKYAESMAQKMFKREALDWLTTKQLTSLMNALQYDAKRNGRRS